MARQQFYKPGRRESDDERGGVYDKPGNLPGSHRPDALLSDTDNKLDDIDNVLGDSESLSKKHKESLNRDDAIGGLGSAEAAAAKAPTGSIDPKEKSLLAHSTDQVGKGFTEHSPKRKVLGRFSRRQVATGGGVTAGLIAAVIGTLSIVQGPLQIVHFAQLLRQFHFSNNESFGDDRSTKFLRNLYKNRPQRSRLGVLGNKYADKYELRLQKESGLRSIYDGTSGKFLGFQVIDETKARSSLDDMSNDGIEPRDGPPPGTNARLPDGTEFKEGRMVNLSESRYRNQRSVIRSVVKGTGTSKLAGSLSSRLLIIRAGVSFHPLQNISKKSGESILDFYRTRREARAQTDLNGADSPDLTPTTAGDSNGSQEGGTTAESAEAASQGNGALGDAVGEGSVADRSVKIKNRMVGVTGFIGVMCAVRTIGNQAEALQHANIVLPLIRIGTRVVTTGFQVMSGDDVSVEDLGSVTTDLYDSDTQTSWASARSIQAENGQTQTGPDIPDEAKPSKIGDKPAFFDFVDKIPGLGAACSGIGQGILSLVGFADTALDIVKTKTLELLNIPNPEDVLAERIVRVLAGEEIDTEAKGAKLGNYANYGSRLAANDQSIAMGGRPLSGTEIAELDAQSKEERNYEFHQQSLYAQLFNIQDANSLVATLGRDLPRNTSSFASMIISSPGRFFGSLFKPAQAATNYDYGFTEYGFSTTEKNSDRYDDPEGNGVYKEVEDNLDYLNTTYGNCFSTTVTIDKTNPDATPRLVSGSAARYDEIEKPGSDCLNTDVLFTDYRFYIADTVTAHTLACNEGDEDSCNQLGFGSVSVGAGAAVEAKGVDTSAQACTIGEDAGIGETPDPAIKIRLCKLSSVTVNVAIEKNLDAILKGTAVDGLDFGEGEGYRPPGVQLERRRTNCGTSQYDLYQKPAGDCNPPTAKPGESLHEWGLAIDFRCSGSTISSRSSACFQWLANNTSLHNLVNLPSEPWHWSTSGG